MFSFTVPGEPVAKGRPRVVRQGNFVKTFTPAKTVNYENWVKACFVEKHGGSQLLDGPLKIELGVYMSIPKSASNKKKIEMLSHNILPTKKPDLDNILKAVSDSLNTLAYNDDKQIVSVEMKKFYSENPRVDVVIREV